MPGKREAAGRKPGERAGLSQRAIVECAGDMARERGVDNVTLRGLAAELGVAPNALYTYFRDRDAILDALLDTVLEGVERPDPEERTWEEALSAQMQASRQVLMNHPHLVPLFIARPGGPNAIRLGETTLRILARGGIQGVDAVLALRTLLSYTFGAAALEAARLTVPERAQRSADALDNMRSLPAEEFPHVRAAAEHLSHHPTEADFAAGLEWLIRGIRRS